MNVRHYAAVRALADKDRILFRNAFGKVLELHGFDYHVSQYRVLHVLRRAEVAHDRLARTDPPPNAQLPAEFLIQTDVEILQRRRQADCSAYSVQGVMLVLNRHPEEGQDAVAKILTDDAMVLYD